MHLPFGRVRPLCHSSQHFTVRVHESCESAQRRIERCGGICETQRRERNVLPSCVVCDYNLDMNSADALNEILASHRLPEYATIIARRLREEADRRCAFYADVTDGEYKLKLKMSSGEITSQVISGFTIPIRAVFDAESNRLAVVLLLQ